jgi:hypothetical protein
MEAAEDREMFVNVVLADEDDEGDAQYKRCLERQEKKRDR